ncbi:MAG TPA: class I SAM-dependent methyltransferase [Acidimicrobiia bacterium]|nr:class I SAM-dependent methyltransferase [Acidimicrobiia bacterium]
MSDPRPPKSFLLSAELADYLVDHGTPPDALQRDLIAETAALGPIAGMQIAPEQGAFLTVLTRLVGARRAVEVGTFTGYSALCIARGLPADGRLLCCDISDEWTAIGRSYWDKAGVSDRIELRLAPAVDTLAALAPDVVFDLAFIDADKPNYPNYYEALLPRMRTNGVILVDNVLWDGNVVKAEADDDNTRAIRAFNDMVAADERVDTVMLPVADGLTVCRKK